MLLLEILIIMLLPALILRLVRRFSLLRKIGAVALCYGCGFLLALLPIPYDKRISQLTASILVALAIPLILFGFDLRSVRRLAKPILAGFGLQVAATAITAGAAGMIASRLGLDFAPQLGGMTIGLYTGGTPNLIAVGSALLPREAAARVITAANTADFLVGGVWFLVLVTVGRPLYRRVLGSHGAERPGAETGEGSEAAEIQNEYDYRSIPRDRKHLLRLAGVCGLAVLCLGVGAGLELLVNGNLDGSLYIMLSVSILGLAGSFIRPVRETKGSYQLGQYLVLMFSLGLSMSVDPGVLVRSLLPTLGFFAAVQLGCILVHLLLCRLFRIDAGAALITNTAGVYGPPFIAPAANAFGDRSLIAPGIICGVLGLMVGNLLGIGAGAALALLC